MDRGVAYAFPEVSAVVPEERAVEGEEEREMKEALSMRLEPQVQQAPPAFVRSMAFFLSFLLGGSGRPSCGPSHRISGAIEAGDRPDYPCGYPRGGGTLCVLLRGGRWGLSRGARRCGNWSARRLSERPARGEAVAAGAGLGKWLFLALAVLFVFLPFFTIYAIDWGLDFALASLVIVEFASALACFGYFIYLVVGRRRMKLAGK
ncbi:MAG: hypothetical protein ACUVXI_05795 [bacterium]